MKHLVVFGLGSMSKFAFESAISADFGLWLTKVYGYGDSNMKEIQSCELSYVLS